MDNGRKATERKEQKKERKGKQRRSEPIDNTAFDVEWQGRTQSGPSRVGEREIMKWPQMAEWSDGPKMWKGQSSRSLVTPYSKHECFPYLAIFGLVLGCRPSWPEHY